MHLFDLHCDTLFACAQQNKALKRNDLHISLEAGSRYKPWFECFAVWIPDDVEEYFKGMNPISLFEKCLAIFNKEAEENPDFIPIRSSEDILASEGKQGCRAILTVENGSAAGGTIEGLERLYASGVRMMTLTWNGKNELGEGSLNPNAEGLTPFGKAAVSRMNELGMIVDVSHLSDRGFYDVAEIAAKPFIASHSNAHKIAPVPRNLTDEQIGVIRNLGGLIGLNFYHSFIKPDSDTVTQDDLLRHIEHFMEQGCEKTLAMGSDFDGADMPPFIRGIDYMEELHEALLRRNYSESLVNDIFCENALRFFQMMI
ncbi:MAG: dipeptidase [Oscillospiraceae bacterium]|jgi:membrane dipeptidase|nr:dipeptidase [Oscillospiraceae bacterium]